MRIRPKKEKPADHQTRHHGKLRPFIFVTAAAILSVSLLAGSARAADTWTGATNALWDTTTDWSLAHKPASNDLASFPGTIPGSGSTITLSSGELADSLSLANSYTFTGGTLALTTGSVNVFGSSTATINSLVTGAGTSMTTTGTGTLVLANPSNDYAGGTVLNGGTLIANGNLSGSGSPLGTGTLTIYGGTLGTTIETNNNNTGTTLNNAISAKGDFSVATNVDISNPGQQDLTFSGAIDLNGATRMITGTNVGGQVSFSNVISNGGVTFTTTASIANDPNVPYVAFIYNGAGANTYTGTTTIAGNAILVLEQTLTDGAIKGDVDVEGDGSIDYILGVSSTGQIANTSTVTDNSAGVTIGGGFYFAGLELRGANETFATLKGTGTVGLGSGTLTISGGDFNGVILDGYFGTGGNVQKIGAGMLILRGNNTYTGATTVTGGTLVVDGSIASSSDLSVASGAKLSGHGSVSKISGAGLVAPGNPQTLTATQVDPSGGLSFAFSFTQPGSPTYGDAAASGNDVLHLTNSTPFVFSLTSANIVTLDFSGASLSTGETFLGGFFADAGISNSILNSADFVFTGLNGAIVQYEGLVTEPSAAFATGTVTNGEVMEFQVMPSPEPSTWMLLAGGIGAFAGFRRFGSRREGV